MSKKISQIKKVVKDYLRSLAQEGVHVDRAILYGSYAQGLAHEGSDIDLLLISKDFARMKILTSSTSTYTIASTIHLES